MILLAFAAFGVPLLAYPDRADGNVSDEALHWLRTQDALGYKIRPLFRQVTDATMTGPTPDHVKGTVVWRTLFGVDVGGRYDVDTTRWAGTWAMFLVAELALGAFVVRQLTDAKDPLMSS